MYNYNDDFIDKLKQAIAIAMDDENKKLLKKIQQLENTIANLEFENTLMKSLIHEEKIDA